MTRSNILRLSLLAATIVAATQAAHAQSDDAAPLTRAQVVAELHAAQAAGAVPRGDLDVDARNHGADIHPERDGRSVETRQQVAAETARAEREGAIPEGDLDATPAQLDPQRYAAARAADKAADQRDAAAKPHGAS